jgi:hypothetical protein
MSIGPHPGLAALFVCISTAIILLVGLPVNFLNSRLCKLLESLGKYSYSLYLVHFPLLIFVYHDPFGGETINASLDIRFFLTLISIIISTLLLYHLVESRNWKKILKSKKITSFALLLIGASTIPISYAINNNSYTDIEREITFAPLDRSVWRCGKYEKLMRVINPSHLTCNLTSLDDASTSENILIIGDSHADAIKQSVANVAFEKNSQVYFMIESCNLGVDDCQVEKIIDIIIDKNISKILLHDFYKNIRFKDISILLNKVTKQKITVYYVDPIPVYSSSIPAYLLKKYKYNYHDQEFHKSKADFELKYNSIYEKLDELDIVRIPTLGSLCSPECQIVIETAPIYADSNHLTLTGAEKLESAFDSAMFQQ